MTQKEIEEAIEELDKRVERLRAMYDQYFLGIERLEPTIQRRDVERRFSGLRREKIRNTAVRFRFNMLIQRFTTYQTFWMRVARQIEEGTYRRDVMKVRQKLELQRHIRKQERLRRMGELYQPIEGIDVDVDVVDEGEDVDMGWEDGEATDLPPEDTRPRIEVHELAAEVRALTKALEESEDPSAPSVLTFGAFKRPVEEEDEEEEETTSAGAAPAPALPAASLGRIALRKIAHTPDDAVVGVREESVTGIPRDALEDRVTPPAPVPKAPPAPPAKPSAPPRRAAMPLMPVKPTAPPPPAKPDAPPAPAQLAAPPAPAKPAAPPVPVRPAARGPKRASAPPPPAPAAPPAPSPPPAKPAAGDGDLRSLFLKRPRPTTGPGPALPASAPPAAAAPSRPAAPDGLPEDRVRAIYDQYRATRRQNNEGDVAFESVKKSIGEMLPKLRQKAPGRELDFEVVVKDGKTVLKPVAK